MKKLFSKSWKSSVQPRKQRKYVYNAPLHIRGKFLSAHLSANLRKEFGRRSLRIVKGDRVKVLRGSFSGISGEVLRVDTKKGKVYIKEASRKKVSGEEVQIPLEPSNLMIIEPETKDPLRLKAAGQTRKKRSEKQMSEGEKERG